LRIQASSYPQRREQETNIMEEPSSLEGDGLEVLYEAIEAGNRTYVIEKLDQHPELVDCWDPALRAHPLHVASGVNQALVAELLIGRGAKLDPRDKRGMTPLHWAARNDCIETARILVHHGADLDAVDSNGWTLLMWSAGSRYRRGPGVAEFLLEHGVQLDLYSAFALRLFDEARRILRGDPQCLASSPRSEDMLAVAVRLISLTIDERTGYTPSMRRLLASNGRPVDDTRLVARLVEEHIDLVRSLIERGAPLERAHAALEAALEIPHPGIAELLLEAGVTAAPRPGASVATLVQAAERSSCTEEMLSLLRRYGVAGDN
jgi:hypothetical protein